MTKTEFANIAMALKSVYNAPNFLSTEQGMTIWYESLKDLDYKMCEIAVMSYISTEEKIPKPANIRNKVFECSQAEELNEMQAWALVSKALRNGIYNAESEFTKLPPTVQSAVGSPENLHNWATSDYETIETVIASNFQRTYRTVVERKKANSMLPLEIRQKIEQIKVKAIGVNTTDG